MNDRWRDRDHGAPCEPEAVAATAITCLFDNRELRAKYGAAVARRVRAEFSLEAMTTPTLALYDEILSGGANASPDAPRRTLAL